MQSWSGCIRFRQSRFQNKENTQDKGEYYILVKGSILPENIILNVYEPNKGTSKYVRQKLIKFKGKTEYTVLALCMGFFLAFF